MSLVASGVPLLPIKTKKQNLEALLDTGSSFSLISESWMKKNNLKFKKSRDLELTCANESVISPIGKTRLKFNLGSREIEWTFYVMKTLLVSLVIGADIVYETNMVTHFNQEIFGLRINLWKYSRSMAHSRGKGR